MDIFTGSPRKIPQSMIVIFILTFLFPSEAAMIKDLIVSRILDVLPGYFMEFWAGLKITQGDFITVWTFLLLAYAVTMVLDILHYLLNSGDLTHIKYSQTSELLLEINSIIFLAFLIYNVLHYPGIKICSVHLSGFYSTSSRFAAILFGIHFGIIYLSDLGCLYVKLDNSNITCFWNKVTKVIFWTAVIMVCTKLQNILFR